MAHTTMDVNMNERSTSEGDAVSDYGSDFSSDEIEILNSLLLEGANIDRRATFSLQIPDSTHGGESKGTRALRGVGREIRYRSEDTSTFATIEDKGDLPDQIIDVNSGAQNVERTDSRSSGRSSIPLEAIHAQDPQQPDLQSPLERFRTKPRKALSVTDVVSPAWCELQYWYSLTKHGRKRRTPAMRQGSAVHKTLEEQVHRTVAIDIGTKEDAWGLRIWNVIQGLRTLRETGLTRELEVWGVVDGELVNGVIDELSYVCPDKDLEEEGVARASDGNVRQNIALADQPILTAFLEARRSQSSSVGVLKSLRAMRKKTSKIYLTDVKTRGVKSVPKGASFRPTLMQLMLYRSLLSDLAANKLNADVLFSRYDLDATAHFSDGFIAQLGILHETFHDALANPSQCSELPDAKQDSVEVLLEHNCLRQLWALMVLEFGRTMPGGADSIGQVLKVEYRHQVDGSILGIKTFLYDHNVIQNYVDDEMSWWRGHREARGVNLEEAYKCRSCEFADGCEWRMAKTEEATMAHRTRSRSAVIEKHSSTAVQDGVSDSCI